MNHTDDFAERFFPEEYRAFANGPLSLCMERFGGIESVHLLDVRFWEGKPFPAMRPVEIFSRNGEILKRPFMAAAFYFENRRSDGVLSRYCPEYPEIHPFGVRSRQCDLLLTRESFCMRLRDSHAGRMAVLIGKPHYFWKQGFLDSNQNQNSKHQPSWLPDELRGKNFDPDFPFPDKGMHITKKPPRFLAEENALVFELDLKFCDHEKKLFAVVTSVFPFEFRELETQWELTVPHDGSRELTVAFGVGGTLAEALDAAGRIEENDQAEWRRATAPERFPSMLHFRISGLPEAELFLRKFPYYQSAALIADTGRECCNRAAQNKFGYFAMWDQLFPLRDYLVMGVPEWTKRSLRHIVTYPHVDSSILISMQTVPAASEYLAFTGDLDFIRELMPHFQRFFAFAQGFCHPESGLLQNTLACAVDVPEELGVTGLFYEAGINGWWYDFCRGLQNMAWSLDMPEEAEIYGAQADRIQAHYLETFYDPAAGFLLGVIPGSKSDSFVPLHIYTATMALEYAHGSALLRPVISALASFQVARLHHPAGHTAVPTDSPVPTINLKAFHMNQHLGHECLCSRLGGRMEEAFHMMRNYLSVFRHYGNAVETFNLCWCMGGGQSQTADWQTFSATGAMQALLHAVIGIAWHRGGLHYLPAENRGDVFLENFHFRGVRCSLHCSGRGSYVKTMRINGKILEGSCQIPADWFEGLDECAWEVTLEDTMPEDPVLLSAADLPVKELYASPGVLRFRAGDTAFASIEFLARGKPRAFRNGRPLSPRSCPGAVWLISALVAKNDLIEIFNK